MYVKLCLYVIFADNFTTGNYINFLAKKNIKWNYKDNNTNCIIFSYSSPQLDETVSAICPTAFDEADRYS